MSNNNKNNRRPPSSSSSSNNRGQHQRLPPSSYSSSSQQQRPQRSVSSSTGGSRNGNGRSKSSTTTTTSSSNRKQKKQHMKFTCMANYPPTNEFIRIKLPYSAWCADTLITDDYKEPIMSILDINHESMGLYQIIFGDIDGNPIAYVTRRLIRGYGKDGWDFCTYEPNFDGQPPYKTRDMYGRTIYPYSYLEILPMRTKYDYSIHLDNLQDSVTLLQAYHGWLGATTVCCTPVIRFGKWQIDFHKPNSKSSEINIDQSRNILEIEKNNDIISSVCIAYAFDKSLCQPLVTIIGFREYDYKNENEIYGNTNDSTTTSSDSQQQRQRKVIKKKKVKKQQEEKQSPTSTAILPKK